jgi:putative Mg2+ transporter-C (MgtC) family protein
MDLPWIDTWQAMTLKWVPLEWVGRLFAAVIAGGVVGWEREKQDKPAGLRTHMLVALGAATFMVAAEQMASDGVAAGDHVRLDPLRVLAAVIGGVGFLGAGTIIQSRGTVRGITTAASLWICASLGATCGIAHYRLAIVAGLFALLVLWIFGRLERGFFEAKGDEPRER